MVESVRVRVTFSFDGEVDEELQSWLITALSGIGATDIDVQQIDDDLGAAYRDRMLAPIELTPEDENNVAGLLATESPDD